MKNPLLLLVCLVLILAVVQANRWISHTFAETQAVLSGGAK